MTFAALLSFSATVALAQSPGAKFESDGRVRVSARKALAERTGNDGGVSAGVSEQNALAQRAGSDKGVSAGVSGQNALEQRAGGDRRASADLAQNALAQRDDRDGGVETSKSATSQGSGFPSIDPGAAPEPLESFEPSVPASAAPVPTGELSSFEPAPSGPSVRVWGEGRLYTGVDTRLDSDASGPLSEHIFEMQGRLRLGADIKLSERFRVVVEGRAFWRVAAQRGFERAKGAFDPFLGETYLDFYSQHVDVRVGSQVLAFGANPALAPSDVLNPRDLRTPFLLIEPEDMKLPVPAVKLNGTLGKVQWTAAYVPFFTPHRYDVFGQDQALVQPALGASAQVPAQIDPSIEDGVQPHLLETERPNAFGWLGDLGLRLASQAGRVKLGASYVWFNEKLPQFTVDPELARALSEQQQGRDDLAALASLRQRAAAGETLIRGRYQRQHVLSVDASALLGPTQLDVDLAYSPLQTLYDIRGTPTRKPAVTWVVGLSQAEESNFIYSVSYLGLLIPDVGAQELIALVEPATAQGAARTGVFHLFVANAAYKLFEGKMELALRAAFEPIQRSFGLAPQVAYVPFDRFRVFVGGEILSGPSLSLFGYYNRNNQVVLGVAGSLL